MSRQPPKPTRLSMGQLDETAIRRLAAMTLMTPSISVDPEVQQLWDKFSVMDPADKEHAISSFIKHATTTLAKTADTMDDRNAYHALAHSVRDRLIKNWNDTQQHHSRSDTKRVYYLSMEFLLGRSLDNAMLALGVKDIYGDGIEDLGFRIEDLIDTETDAALGNGGLGRLAACYMDSLATHDYPAWGYGIRYTYGIFQQGINDGYQVERPDYWLTFGNPWEVMRQDIVVEVPFGGHVYPVEDSNWPGGVRKIWEGSEFVRAVAYDVPIPGYQTRHCINIRLWSSHPRSEFNLDSFNAGDYQNSVDEQMKAETITAVLYPNDNHMVGKELRLKQQYFFVRATLHDIVRRFKKSQHPWVDFPNQVAIQLNDTHPTLGIVELQRVLVDQEGLHWDEAWDIVTCTYAFTNHTVLPEAMEKWQVPMMQRLLPRHMEIIFAINLFFLQRVEKKFPNDRDILKRMSIIEEGSPQQVRMAHLAVVGSHTVNGVAALHSQLIKDTIFKDFVVYYGENKFQNKTNGITPRRWLHQANPELSQLITETLGNNNWLKDLSLLKGLAAHADNEAFQTRWMTIKRANKSRLADHIRTRCGIDVSIDALFDVQVKRLHEYKRQFMNILSVIHRYSKLRRMSSAEKQAQVPRVVIFGGKAAPGYYIAKLVIKLINSVAEVVNADASLDDLLKVVFIPDYNVSLAEVIVPASDISQHISTAGTEASGTSNMKFVLNGGIILGTVDGANIEIAEEIGDDNIFTFGKLAHEVDDIRHHQTYHNFEMNPDLKSVLDVIQRGEFGDPEIYKPLVNTLTDGRDYYLLSADFDSYLEAQARVDEAYKHWRSWAKKSILCTANMGKFSSDRSVKEYAEQIWSIKPCQINQ
ncbi:glycosyl transferase [Syncephalis plumigaleata]|nr:glycosyl transferase [Syncephalis plumigaleata]